MTSIGNMALWNLEKTAFLSSRKVPPEAVTASCDWAAKARDGGTCVIGGFQSALEREVLKILLKGRQPIVMALARGMWSTVPPEFRDAINEGRLLAVSPVAQGATRASEASAASRNRFVLANCVSATFAAVSPGGSLERLLGEFPSLPVTVLAPCP